VELFADRDLGGRIFPGIVRAAGITLHAHADHFPPDAPDAAWLPEAARRGWVIVSADQRIMRVPLERDAVFLSGARLLVLIGGSAPVAALAHNFVNTFARIERFIQQNEPPFIARVHRPNPVSGVEMGRPGDVRMALTHDEWKRRYGGR
jgi:PIN like domain